MQVITIELTDDQKFQLDPIFKQLRKENAEDKEAAIIAQVYEDGMRVMLADEEFCKTIRSLSNKKREQVGKEPLDDKKSWSAFHSD